MNCSRDVIESMHADYLATIASYRRDDGYEIPGEFVVCRGVVPFGP